MKQSHINNTIAIVFFMAMAIVSCRHDTSSWHPVNERLSFKELKGERVFENMEFIFPQRLATIGDKLLIQDSNMPDGKMFVALDIENAKSPVYVGSQGVGPGEFLNPRVIDYSTYDSCLYIYDAMLHKGRLFKVSPDSFNISTSNMVREFSFPSVSVSDNHRISSGFVTQVVGDGMMFTLVDTLGKIVTRFGTYPGDNAGINTSPLKFSIGHQTLTTANNKKGRFVSAGVTSDWLAFYSINDFSPELIREYFTFETPVDVTETQSGDNYTVSARDNNSTRTCFTQLLPTPDYVFAVYAGSTEQEREDGTAHKVVVMKFDWDGTLIKGYVIPDRSGAKAISQDGKYLYAVVPTDDDNMIIKRYFLP